MTNYWVKAEGDKANRDTLCTELREVAFKRAAWLSKKYGTAALQIVDNDGVRMISSWRDGVCESGSPC